MNRKKILKTALILGVLVSLVPLGKAISAVEPPRIISTYPAAGTEVVDSSGTIVVTFNRAMSPDSFHVFSVWLEDSGTGDKKYVKIRYVSDKRSLHIIPVEPLPKGRNYEVILSSEVVDVNGVTIGDEYKWGFTVAAPGAVGKKSEPRAEIVEEATIQEVTTKPAEVTPVETKPVVVEPVKLEPAKLDSRKTKTESSEGKKPVLPVEKVVVQEDSREVPAAGTVQIQPTDYQKQRPFKLLSTFPLNGTNDVPTDTKVTLYFTRKLDPASIVPGCVKIFADGTPVPATVRYEAIIRRIIVIPEKTLKSAQQYTVQASAAIRDDLGRELGFIHETSFQTSDHTPAATEVEDTDNLKRPELVSPVPQAPPQSQTPPRRPVKAKEEKKVVDLIKIREEIHKRLEKQVETRRKEEEKQRKIRETARQARVEKVAKETALTKPAEEITTSGDEETAGLPEPRRETKAEPEQQTSLVSMDIAKLKEILARRAEQDEKDQSSEEEKIVTPEDYKIIPDLSDISFPVKRPVKSSEERPGISEKLVIGKTDETMKPAPESAMDGLAELGLEELDGDEVAALEETGLEELGLDELGGEEVAALEETGLEELGLDELGGEEVAALEETGLEELGLDELGGEEVAALEETGLEELGLDELGGEEVAALEETGLEELGLDELGGEEVTSPEATGLEELDMEELGMDELGGEEVTSPEATGLEELDMEELGMDELGGEEVTSPEATGLEELDLEELGVGEVGVDLPEIEPPAKPADELRKAEGADVSDTLPIQPLPVAFSPADGSVSVPASSTIEVVFDSSLDPITVSPLTIRLTADGESVAGSLRLDGTGTRLVFLPRAPLIGGTWHYLEIDESVKSVSGGALGKTMGVRFKTEEIVDLVAPFILHVVPDINAKKVRLDTRIVVSFSEAIDRKTLTPLTFIAARTGESVYGEIVYDEKKYTAVFAPAKPLEPGTEYTVGIAKRITDTSGNELKAGLEWKFATVPPQDSTPPYVTAVFPEDGARGVAPESLLEITFNEKVDQVSLTPFALTVNDGTKNIKGDINYYPAEMKAVFTPAESLRHSTTYRATVKAVLDRVGNIMDKPVAWVFSTKDPPDFTPPHPIYTHPHSGARDQNVFPSVYVEFDEDLTAKSVNPFTVYLEDDSGLRMAGEVIYDRSERKVFFTPATELKYATRYRMVLTTDITDLAGNRMAEEITWSFDTMKPVDKERPTIVSVSPAVGAEKVLVNAHVLTRFSEQVNEVTISPVSFRVLKSGQDMPGVLYYNPESFETLFVPNASFDYATTYKVVVEQNIEDLAGNPLALRAAWTFTTEPPPDTVPPRVVRVSPVVGAQEVSLETDIIVEFNEPVDVRSLNAFNFGIRYESRDVSGEISYDVDSRTAHFKPLKPLLKNTLYEAVVDRGVIDPAGNLLENRFSWRFMTGKEYRARPASPLEDLPGEVASYVSEARLKELPQVTTTEPREGDVNVPLDEEIVLYFNKPMDKESLDRASVFLLDDDGEIVPAAYIYEESSMRLVLRPRNGLSYNAVYTCVALAHMVKDILGTTLVDNVSLTFETAQPGGIPKLTAEEKTRMDEGDKWIEDDEGPVAAEPDDKKAAVTDETVTARSLSDELKVIAVSPRNGAVNVVETPSITATFTMDVDPLTINRYTISLDDGDRFVEGEVSYDTATKKVMFIPRETLKQGVTYRGTVTADVKDLKGKGLDRDKVWTFTILERVGPEIVETIPPSGADDVHITTNIRAVFNKQIVGVTVTPFTFKVRSDEGDINGEIRYNNVTKEAIFVPKETLGYGTTYTAIMMPDVQDPQGNQLNRRYLWTFTTSGDPY